MEIVTVPVADKFDTIASTYDDQARYLEQWDGQVLLDMIGDVRGKSVLDIGCGTGRLLSRLRDLGADTVGIDVSGEMVRVARGRGLRVFQRDILEFEWEKPFDLIISVTVFNYIEDKANVLRKVRSLLKPSGGLVLSMELQLRDTAVPRGDHAVAAPHFPLTKGTCSRLVLSTGFTVEESRDLLGFDEFRGDGDLEVPVGFILVARKPGCA